MKSPLAFLRRRRSEEGGVQILTLDELLKRWEESEDNAARGPSSALTSSPVAAAHRILTNAMACMPVDLYRKDGSRRESVEKHPSLYALTVRANENMSPYTFKKVMESKCFWYGEAFAYIDRSGSLMRLIPLPDAHQMYEDEQGGRWYSFTAETKELDLTRKFHEDELLHLRFETGNGRYGIGILQMARDAIRTDLLSQKYAGKFYKQGARPSGIIEVPTKLDQANKDKVRASFERMVGGMDGAFRVAVMDLGMKYTQLGISQRDAQFIESRQFTVEEVARFTGVPEHKLQSGKQSYESNQAQAIEYVQGTLLPRAVQWEEEMRYKLLLPRERQSLYYKFNLASAMRGDDQSRSTYFQRMIASAMMTPNEGRALEDMNDLEGGDELLVTKNLTTLKVLVAGGDENGGN